MIGIFATLERQEVLGMLKKSGIRDKDILASEKIQAEKFAKFQKTIGTVMLVGGIIACIPVVTAILGIPFAIAGWFVRQRGVKNIATVESAYTELSAAL